MAQQVVGAVQRIRQIDLKKVPSISETLDWAKALTLLNVTNLDAQLVTDTLSAILKYEGDLRKAEDELKDYIQRQKAKTQPATPPVTSTKDYLH